MDLLLLAGNLANFFVVLLFSLCFHEVAHGLVAKWRGDNTAQIMGRLTMNPIPHMDMVGTVILPMMTILMTSMGSSPPLFGWAKPVPVNERNLKNPRTDMFWIAIAGPMSNVFLAIIGAVVLVVSFRYFATTSHFGGVKKFLSMFITTNLFLAFFNLIPLHPLDGGKVIARFLPASLNRKLEENEQMTSLILLVLIVVGALQVLSIPVIWSANVLITLVERIFL